MKSQFTLFLAALLLLAGCKVRQTKPDAQPPLEASQPPQRGASPATPAASAFPYRPSDTKAFDLIHTRLAVRFDWAQEQMKGEALLTLRPWFFPTQDLVLDAKGFLLHEVALQVGDHKRKLDYQYDNEKLRIRLDRTYASTETLMVYIDYTARPAALDSLVSEEAAGDQGLYFINPRGEIPGKPRQVWTQGESHGSPGWFPTFDSPNQRCTDEIFITVADSFETLSNGVLVDSKYNPDGSRTDHWRMDLPHAPYLFMMAVGNYAIVRDQWRGREVSYYVEPAYEKYARLIFGKTPQMMEFFSTKLGVDYPWPKYSQVVVRDFVSGAMENTSATTHYGRLQHDAREHLDATEEDIISHELFHQWFGDLVTCESWANLSLNEGFATYGEFLWIEHAYGSDAAMRHLQSDRSTYLRSSSRGAYPIIRYHHETADAMFDAHSYQKGGQVLHMLRKLVGDDAFFAGLKRYLTQHAYDDVEIHELRLAFEEVSGQDLNWFFDQWYLQPGHPELELTHGYADGKYSLRVQQVQDLNAYPTFRFPLALDYVVGSQHQRIQLWVASADTTFEIAAEAAPSHVCFDPDRDLLCSIRKVDGLAPDAWVHQVKTGQGHLQKAEAVERLVSAGVDKEGHAAVLALATDRFWATRQLALSSFGSLAPDQVAATITVAEGLLADEKSAVRVAAIAALGEHFAYLHQPANAALKARIADRLYRSVSDSSYAVGRSALEAYYLLDSVAGLALAEKLISTKETHLAGGIARILREAESEKALPFIMKQLRDPSAGLSAKSSLLRGFGAWLQQRPAGEQAEGIEVLMELVVQDRERWVRFFAVQSLLEMEKAHVVETFFQARIPLESDGFVKSAMQRYLDTK